MLIYVSLQRDYLDNVVNLVWLEKKVNVVVKARSVPKAQLANKENGVFKESWDHLDLRVSPPSVVILDLLDLRVKLAVRKIVSLLKRILKDRL